MLAIPLPRAYASSFSVPNFAFDLPPRPKEYVRRYVDSTLDRDQMLVSCINPEVASKVIGEAGRNDSPMPSGAGHLHVAPR
jgi:hypothetical protein